MYQVLYRKYRPRVFADVVGQPQVTVTLKNEIASGRIHHAYLFTGSRGTGKTTCAKILAKAVNCLHPVDNDPCGECENCRGIDSGEIFDVVEMDAASNRGIDDIRAIIDEVSFTPAKAKYRVYIVDEVHMLSRDAWNALLKTLEEPPAHVIFILATTEVHKIPETILSRCQRFDFHRIAPADIAERLKYICSKENAAVTDEAALLISVIADGALRDAISLLDRCIGISSDITADTVRAAAGLAGKSHLFELVNCCIRKNPQKALSLIDKLYKESKSMSRLTDEVISHLRSLMLIKTVRNPRELLVMSDNEYEAAVSQADCLSLADIVYAMDVLSRAMERMQRSSSARTELEIAMLKLCAPELEATNEALVTRVAALEKAIKRLSARGVAPAPAPVIQPAAEEKVTEPVAEEAPKPAEVIPEPLPKPEPAPEAPAEPEPETIPDPHPEPIPQPEATPAPEEPIVAQPAPERREKPDMAQLYDAAKPFSDWTEVIASLEDRAYSLYQLLQNTNAYVSGDYLLIDTQNDFVFEMLRKSNKRREVREAIAEITGRPYNLGPYKRPEEKKPDDVLTGFIGKLRDAGVSVTVEEE